MADVSLSQDDLIEALKDLVDVSDMLIRALRVYASREEADGNKNSIARQALTKAGTM